MKKLVSLVIVLSLILSSMLFTNVFAQTQNVRYDGEPNIFEFEKTSTIQELTNQYPYFAVSGYAEGNNLFESIAMRTESEAALNSNNKYGKVIEGSVYRGTYAWVVKVWNGSKFAINGTAAQNIAGNKTSVPFKDITFEKGSTYRTTFYTKIATTLERTASNLEMGSWATETSFQVALAYGEKADGYTYTTTMTDIATSASSDVIKEADGWQKISLDITLTEDIVEGQEPKYIRIIPAAGANSSGVYYYIDDLTFEKVESYKNINNFNDDAANSVPNKSTYVVRREDAHGKILAKTDGDNYLWSKRPQDYYASVLAGMFDNIKMDTNGKYRVSLDVKISDLAEDVQDGYSTDTNNFAIIITNAADTTNYLTDGVTIATSGWTEINKTAWKTVTYEFSPNGETPVGISWKLQWDMAFLMIDNVVVEYITPEIEMALTKDDDAKEVTATVKALSAPIDTIDYIVAVYDDGVLVETYPYTKPLAEGAVATEILPVVDIDGLTNPSVKIFSWDMDTMFPLTGSEGV